MRVTKQTGAESGRDIDAQELALINQWTRKELDPDKIYVFGVRLCDNEIDRDGERFPTETLKQMAKLFVGKSGVFDHQWSAKDQAARIYRTELVQEEGLLTRTGEAYCYLKGWAYMLRTEGNSDLIDEIEGGIKKEVSVGCAVSRKVCSICGAKPGACGHLPGQMYDGKICCTELLDATDAYEWSFVAVPAQKKAGVMKSFVDGADELETLKAEAAMGRRYLEALRKEVARLGGLTGDGPDATVLRPVTEKLNEEELLALKKAFEEKVKNRFRPTPQLTYSHAAASPEDDNPFLI